jgi:glycosyltransferase involved in cell wall biosynthesis
VIATGLPVTLAKRFYSCTGESQQLKILYFNPGGNLGGAERALLDLMQAVRHARPDSKLELLAGSGGDFTAAAQELGIRVHVIPLPTSLSRLGDAGAGGPAGDAVSKASVVAALGLSAPKLTLYLWRLRRFLSDRDPDQIHSNGLKTHILAAIAAPRRSRMVWHVHDYVGARPLMSRLIRLLAGRCDAAITNSHSVACDLEAVCRGSLKIQTVYNAVDLERFNPGGPMLDLDALSGLPPAVEGTVRVGLIATMARWKGHKTFLQALSIVPKTLPIRGYVIGGPIYETQGSQYTLDELRNLARDLGLNGRIAFTGYIDDPASAMRALDIVVHASTQPEPFGLAVAEAMACGKPVVASNAGGVSEIIADNETVLSHAPGDAMALADRILKLARDPQYRRDLGDAARLRAERSFERRRLAAEIFFVYDSFMVASHCK